MARAASRNFEANLTPVGHEVSRVSDVLIVGDDDKVLPAQLVGTLR